MERQEGEDNVWNELKKRRLAGNRLRWEGSQ